MYDPIYEEYLDKPAISCPAFIQGVVTEATCALGTRDVKVTHSTIASEEELRGWAMATPSLAADVCVVKLLQVLGLDTLAGDLPFTRLTFEVLLKEWHLPSMTLGYWYDCSPRAFTYRWPLGTGPPEWIGIMGTFPRKKFALAFNTQHRTLHGIFSGASNDHASLQQALQMSEVICNPVVLPLLLLERELSFWTADLIFLSGKITAAGVQLGMDAAARDPAMPPDNVDYDAVIRQLTSVSRRSAWLKGNHFTQQSLITNIKQLDWHIRAALRSSHSGRLDATYLEIEERLRVAESALGVLLNGAERVQGETQSLIQTLYCLVSTKDSRLSYRATEASLAIAQDSRHIAILTSRDSTDMRIIAVLTLIFLPGAFVATILSSTFFDFHANDATDSSRVVSKRFWVFWVVTAVLTAIVVGIWWGLHPRILKSDLESTGSSLDSQPRRADEKGGLSAQSRFAAFWVWMSNRWTQDSK